MNGHPGGKTLYGLLGRRLGHSFSAKFFNEKFRREGINAEYRNFEIESASQLRDIIARHPELRGLNVTVPFKEEILPYLDSITPEAREIGAVNTLIIRRHDSKTEIFGANTDATGFLCAIRPFAPESEGTALVLGTGGAAKAVGFALRSAGIKVIYVSRSKRNDRCIGYDEIDAELLRRCRFIVNATPLGMWPDTDSFPPVPYALIRPETLCIDLTYNPAVTAFMSRCARQGAAVMNGLTMLRHQAEESWRIWIYGL